MSDCCDIVIAGAAIIDIPVVPADASVFTRISTPAGRIILTSGGDAMNEALVLSRLGRRVRLVTRIGCDDAGAYLKRTCASAGIDTQHFREMEGLDTGINVVLVDNNGERRFFTNPHGSLRALEACDITPEALDGLLDRVTGMSRALLSVQRPHAVLWLDGAGEPQLHPVSDEREYRLLLTALLTGPAGETGPALDDHPELLGAGVPAFRIHISAGEGGDGHG